MGEVGGFRGRDHQLAVGADSDALWLRPDPHFARDLSAIEVEERHRAVVLVGDVQCSAVRAQGEPFGVASGVVQCEAVVGPGVPRLDPVGVARGDVEGLAVGRECHSPRPGAGQQAPFDPARCAVDHRHISGFVRNEDGVGRRLRACAAVEGQEQCGRDRQTVDQARLRMRACISGARADGKLTSASSGSLLLAAKRSFAAPGASSGGAAKAYPDALCGSVGG